MIGPQNLVNPGQDDIVDLNQNCIRSNLTYSQCDYVDHEFIRQQKNDIVLHVNVCSLDQNAPNLRTLLNSLDNSIKIVCMTEVWQMNKPNRINDYTNSFYNLRKPPKKGGGVGILLKTFDIAKKLNPFAIWKNILNL